MEGGVRADTESGTPTFARDRAARARRRAQLALLTVRQQTTLRHRFGIDVERDHTLQEIDDMLLIMRERARQIEAQALRQLRARPAPRGANPDRPASRARRRLNS